MIEQQKSFLKGTTIASKILNGYVYSAAEQRYLWNVNVYGKRYLQKVILNMYKTIFNRKVLYSIVFILGIKILQQHLKSQNLSLYIDAKGGVVKKTIKNEGRNLLLRPSTA